jgi:DNA-damage-inducible protein D
MPDVINKKSIAIFENDPVRRIWLDKEEKWMFSVVDVIRVLAQNNRPRKYWNDLKTKLKEEGSQLSEKIGQLKMLSQDGKFYETDVGDVETILRLIQSIPSPKAEPFKLWLAKVGYERVQEISDPEKALNRSRGYWQKMGRSSKWIQQRMMGQEVRNKLTDYWKNNEVKEKEEYAILTNIIHQEWSDLSVKEHKDYKGLKTENLRDHMTDAELVFTALAELSTRQIAETMETKGLEDNKIPARKGGTIAKNARLELEQKTGKKIISSENFKQLSGVKKKLLKNKK